MEPLIKCDKYGKLNMCNKYGNSDISIYDKYGNLNICNKYGNLTIYDKYGNLIFYQSDDEVRHWLCYNEDNKIIYEKDSLDQEIWYKYDENGKQIKIDKQIIIDVKGGMIVDIHNADNYSIIIRDYDIQGEVIDHLKIDKNGEEYRENSYYQ
jgi:YD repeat-containing protein